MKLILADTNHLVVEAWQQYCSSIDGIVIRKGSIFEQDCQAIVSPGNSFGFMDGGLDLSILNFFGLHIQERLQHTIFAQHHGELIVGLAELINTDHHNIPYVIAAPTMRVPMILGDSTINVYLAMRAVLLLVKFGTLSDSTPLSNIIETVAVSGLGTGVGKVPPAICARQMRTAIEDIMLNKSTFPNSWVEAQMRHQLLYSNSSRNLQYPD